MNNNFIDILEFITSDKFVLNLKDKDIIIDNDVSIQKPLGYDNYLHLSETPGGKSFKKLLTDMRLTNQEEYALLDVVTKRMIKEANGKLRIHKDSGSLAAQYVLEIKNSKITEVEFGKSSAIPLKALDPVAIRKEFLKVVELTESENIRNIQQRKISIKRSERDLLVKSEVLKRAHENRGVFKHFIPFRIKQYIAEVRISKELRTLNSKQFKIQRDTKEFEKLINAKSEVYIQKVIQRSPDSEKSIRAALTKEVIQQEVQTLLYKKHLGGIDQKLSPEKTIIER